MVDVLILREWQRVVCAVHARARSVDKVRDTGVTAAFEHGAERVDVVAQIRGGIDQRIAHARLCGEVRDMREASVAQQRRARCRVREIERFAGHTRSGELLGPGAFEGDVVVGVEVVGTDDAHAVALQAQGEMHADKPGSSGNKDLHRARSACSSARSFAYLQKLANAPIAMWTRPALPSRNPARNT